MGELVTNHRMSVFLLSPVQFRDTNIIVIADVTYLIFTKDVEFVRPYSISRTIEVFPPPCKNDQY